jgi:hypothetical protein
MKRGEIEAVIKELREAYDSAHRVHGIATIRANQALVEQSQALRTATGIARSIRKLELLHQDMPKTAVARERKAK